MLIILSGSIGRLPFGGHAWHDMQYLAGLQALGHNVVYLEDCGDESWVYNWETEEVTTDLKYPAAYIRNCLEPLGLDGRWIYRAGKQCEGMSVDELKEICSRADLIMIHAVPLSVWREEYVWPRHRVFIDTDPGFTQFSVANGHRELTQTINSCEFIATIGQRIGMPDCPIPTLGRKWFRTVHPIALNEWPEATGEGDRFTSVMQWKGFREVVYDGVRYGQKDAEFPKYMDLPRLTSQKFQLALTGAPPEQLSPYGWEVVPGWISSRTPQTYKAFIQGSRAEFSVAKHGYVLSRGGWFSDRSICYLASGRPVLVQDTGQGDWLPTGEGALTFRDLPEALAGVQAINADYERHALMARRLAEEYFAADRVLPPLLEAAAS